ncbi:glycosyltransferase family 2 protein [Brevibacterium aurantiacum]|uniref:Glycosyltransferase family 2 protein n=1 Tax=Brevibacterium aurantiacum TaxID=273384 RepID=A0A556CA92_BREAU|nr:glycosyltransferase family 2 protein [Brevibacterium aurantiacum]TSI13948.1 glycosyltransferase family 2 protein [Brevibacterium aurantiacum]
MKDSEVKRRQDQIGQRVQELKSLRTSQKALRDHTNSGYFLDGLLGHHPYLVQARTRAEYLERYESFAGPVEDKISSLIAESQKLPVVTGQRWDTRRDLRIGIIADRFLFDSLKDAAHFVPIDPDGSEEQMEELDLLLITSAWRGLDDEWFNVALSGSPARYSLETSIVPLARERGIPIAFYSKEDPPNYARFASLATLADHVFTSAIECVPRYRSYLGPEVPVSVLPFAVNYVHHNPLGCMRHQEREFVFAGSWLEHKYPERKSAALRIFDGLLEAGADLTIVDRNLELDDERFANPERYLFPERYLPHLHRPLDHEVLLGLQRLLPVSINLNSVTASQSMYANRVIELQAMGTYIVSNYNAGMNSLHPQVCIPDSVLDMKQTYQALTRSSIRQAQVAGIRHAFTDNTAFDRIDTIAEAMGLSSGAPEHTVYVTGLSAHEFEEFRATQTYAGQVESLDTVGDSHAAGPDGDVVLDLAGSAWAGPHLVQDAVNAFRYSDVDEVLIHPIDSADDLFEYADRAERSGSEADNRQIRATWARQGTRLGEIEDVPRAALAIASDLIADRVESITVSAEPEISIVVPVYNNGPHLKFKCFESLRRSSIFDRAEVLLIDDGSTDLETVAILNELDRAYPNVRVHRFPPGGSGSASRPRNKGLELTRTPYVTYLDPDNEQTNDGFAELLAMVKDNDYQFAIGNMVRFKDKRITVKNAPILQPVVGEDGELGDNALSRVKFQPMSIQALVADTRWLKSLGIYQPVGAVGQDSYFFQQMLFHANRIGLTNTAIHTYYAAVTNSTVNAIGPRFYEKYLPLEEHRATWLRDVGLLEDYNAKRLEPFVKGWFVKKLDFVAPEDQAACRALIRHLTRFYGKSTWTDPDLATFHSTAHG